MSYHLITVHAGHKLNGGARGCGYEESAVARQILKLVLESFAKVGQRAVDTTDNTPGNQSDNLTKLVRNCNAHSKHNRLDLSLHLNSGGGTGVEVLFYDQRELAAKVSKAIANVTGLRDRGAKQRKDLYVLAKTNAPAILVEFAFIDNQNDMNLLMCKMQEIVDAIVEVVTGKAVRTVSKAKYIVTGGLKPDAIREFSQYICERNWWAKLEFSDGVAIATTGGLSGQVLEDFKLWLDERGWWYTVKDV